MKMENQEHGEHQVQETVETQPQTATPQYDEKTIWTACRKYAKTYRVSDEEAKAVLSMHPHLMETWAKR